ncbi:hypothetical protein NM688_g2584 [Phlebia brevispora]|uniref:Uncharacterized protein n=1 Tax=Phlebia brevispora TaxID=194682 RepID=A0ACC1T837_9APHY|nr:hypothetical protein NM688_g2584 [Phlebia brevispora]
MMSSMGQDLMARTLSRSRRSTSASTSSSKPVMPMTGRRRLLPEQIQALQDLYELNSHPSKEERVTLARELNLELKAVNVWYQNKRRSMKKKSLAWSKASSENQLGIIDPLAPSKSYLGRACSLDAIVSSRELRDPTPTPTDDRWSLTRPPLTPRRNRNVSHRPRSSVDQRQASPGPSSRNDHSEKPIWEHIPSSPPLPPSSPSDDAARFAFLPPSSRLLRSLEYACAKDRLKRRKFPWLLEEPEGGEHDADVPGLDLDEPSEETADEVDEVITPENSLTMESRVEIMQGDVSPTSRRAEARARALTGGQERDDVKQVPAEDVEAAMALLGFSVHK